MFITDHADLGLKLFRVPIKLLMFYDISFRIQSDNRTVAQLPKLGSITLRSPTINQIRSPGLSTSFATDGKPMRQLEIFR